LDAEIRNKIGQISLENRALVTYHDSIVHFANRYGLSFLGSLMGADGRAPARDQAALTQLAKDNHLPAVFAEAGYDKNAMRAVADALGISLCNLHTDTADSDQTAYLDMMRDNVDEIVHCLGG
jgi:ABC-type Zn uptake system ZnuABC Zn-binding protein ZnuA